jgi:hypothetical protein
MRTNLLFYKIPRTYLAESLVKINNGQAITSILNARNEDVDISITELELTEQDSSNVTEVLTAGLTQRGASEGNTSLSRGRAGNIQAEN